MGYSHDFTGLTDRVRSTAPVRWRQFDSLLAAYWEASGDASATGYYLSANPRLSLFFSDVSSIEVMAGDGRHPMARAIYVPAGMPLRTAFTRPLSFSHLDIHMEAGWAARFLSPVAGPEGAAALLARPAERRDTAELEPVARLLVEELSRPARQDLFAESLARALVAGVLDPGMRVPRARPEPAGETAADPVNARLTAAQMRKVAARFERGGGRRMSIAQMAAAVNLSESWFSQVFKNTTGMTPHQWQLEKRIAQARGLLTETPLSVADIADRLGFSDQAHLTRSFRQLTGETPAAWRRSQRMSRAGG